MAINPFHPRQIMLQIGCALSILISLAACAQAVPSNQAPALPTASPTLAVTDTITPSPQPTSTATPTPPPTETPLPNLQVCSPLESFTLEDLPSIISNPYNPPRPGDDRPHHGVDFSFFRLGDRLSIQGLPVHAALAGTVATVINDRFPYGNTLIIETPLDVIPPSWIDLIPIPTTAPTLAFIGPLTCPGLEPHPAWQTSERSLFLLYSHLHSPPELQPGDRVECGQPIGEVGNTGNSINPHLHLEVRVGPRGARLGSMSHYDNSASETERYYYCVWRISQLFQKIDPGNLLFSGLE